MAAPRPPLNRMENVARQMQHREWSATWNGRDVGACLLGVAVGVAGERTFRSASQPPPNVAAASSIALYGLLLGLLLGITRLRGVRVGELGWRAVPLPWLILAPIAYLAVAIIEVVLGAVTIAFAGTPSHDAQCDLVQFELGAATALVILHSVILAPLVEETIFRGIVFPYLRRYSSFIPAALASSVLFAAMHLQPRSLLVFTGLGVLFAWLRERTRSIWPSVVLHATANTVAVVLVAHVGCV
jgi:uncharacterized protein